MDYSYDLLFYTYNEFEKKLLSVGFAQLLKKKVLLFMTKEQKFKKEYAFELLKIAEGDLETTKVLLLASTGRKENVCFNAQQVIKKSIRAALCFLELPVPFTHNLDILIDRLPKNMALTDADNINELTEYATIRRYEEGTFDLDSEDLKKAYSLAEVTLKWARKICSI